MMLVGVQVGSMPAMSYRKRWSISWPCWVCATSGWNCTPARRAVRFSNAATGAPAEEAVTVKPCRRDRSTLSPWLIQTGRSAGSSRSSVPAWAVSTVRPYSRAPVCATVPPSAWAIAWKP